MCSYLSNVKKLRSIERLGAPSICKCNVMVNVKCKCQCRCQCHYIDIEETGNHYINIEETSSHYINIEETRSKCNVNVFDGKKESLPSFKCIIVFVDCHHCRSNKIILYNIIDNCKTNLRIKFDQIASQESGASASGVFTEISQPLQIFRQYLANSFNWPVAGRNIERNT